MKPTYSIVQYIRDRKGLPVGAIVSVKSENGFNIGYSLCNRRDRFKKDLALKIAFARASFDLIRPDIPRDISKALPAFIERCQRYYKTKHTPKFKDYFETCGR